MTYHDGHFEQTFYVYDVSDNMMAAHTKRHAVDGNEKMLVNEYFIYRSKRLSGWNYIPWGVSFLDYGKVPAERYR